MKTFCKIILSVAFAAIGFGILIMVIWFSAGGYRNYNPKEYTYSYQYQVEQPEQITKLDFDISYGDVKIREGNSFLIDVRNTEENSYKSYVRNGTWYIETKENEDNFFNFFGFHIPVNVAFGKGDWSYVPKVEITVPKGFFAERIDVELGAGELYSNQLSGKRGFFEIGAGSITMDNLTITEQSRYEAGVGSINVSATELRDVTAHIGMGDVRFDGNIIGDNTIESGIGEVTVFLSGSDQDFDFFLDSGIGDTIFNNSEYAFVSRSYYGSNSIGSFRLETGIGSVKCRTN